MEEDVEGEASQQAEKDDGAPRAAETTHPFAPPKPKMKASPKAKAFATAKTKLRALRKPAARRKPAAALRGGK